jgi:hypothetical protein
MTLSRTSQLVRWSALAGVAALSVGLHSPLDAQAKLKFSSGRVTYKMDAPSMTGTTVFSWLDGGKRFRQEMSTVGKTPQGKPMMISLWVIFDGKSLYVHNPMRGKVVTRTPMTADSLRNLGGVGMFANRAKLGKVVGKGNIAGKSCQIFQPNPNGKVWMWEGLVLKTEGTGGTAQTMKMEATKVETGITLKPTLFQPPKGMKIEEIAAPKIPAKRK